MKHKLAHIKDLAAQLHQHLSSLDASEEAGESPEMEASEQEMPGEDTQASPAPSADSKSLRKAAIIGAMKKKHGLK